jgi:membrane-bound ClpP family serine protease
MTGSKQETGVGTQDNNQGNDISSLLLTIQEMRMQIEELSEFRGKYEKAVRQTEKYRVKLHGSENVCQSQQSLIEMQANEMSKLKHKVRKYKKKVQ